MLRFGLGPWSSLCTSDFWVCGERREEDTTLILHVLLLVVKVASSTLFFCSLQSSCSTRKKTFHVECVDYLAEESL